MSIYIDNLNDDMEDMDEECPLCMEPLEIDDLNFYPCTCGYQICRFCWHRIRTDENGLCPACRKAYSENPADFKPLSNEELQKIKRERKATEASRRQKLTESRKHLASVRVVQKNLVFVVGLGPRLADTEVLRKNEYFGKFGKIHKVVVNHTTTYAGSQGPSASAYITYLKEDDSLRAIQAVNNLHVDGRTLKASLGTTKYCSSFLNSPQCPKPVTCPRADCMYLHELGDEEASFTKEEMQLGRHTEFEQRLHEALNRSETQIATTSSSSYSSSAGSATTPTLSSSGFPTSAPVSAIPPVCAETPIPLMASSAGSSASSSLGNPSSSTIVSLMGLDLSKTISARKKSSQSPPPPPPSLTSLMMDSRGVIKPSNKPDAPPGMEWPALGGSKALVENDYPQLSREHSSSMDFGLASETSSAGMTTTTTTATSSEVPSFSTIVNGEISVSEGGGGGEAERRRSDVKEGDSDSIRAASGYTARTMTMMEIGAGDGIDAARAGELVEVAAEEAAIAAAATASTDGGGAAAAIIGSGTMSKKAKKKARKDGTGSPGEDSANASGQEASKKSNPTAGTNNNNNKKQQQQSKDSGTEKSGKGNNSNNASNNALSAKAQNVKGDKSNKKKSKEESAKKNSGKNESGTKEKSGSSDLKAAAAAAALTEVGAGGDAKKSKQITSLDAATSDGSLLPVGMDASHLPPSPSPSPPISSTPNSSQSSSLSSTPSSGNSLSTAASKDPALRQSDMSSTNVEMSTAGNPVTLVVAGGDPSSSSSSNSAAQALPTPTASPESSVGPHPTSSLPLSPDSYPSSTSLSSLSKGSSAALPIRLEQNPNSSFFSNEFTRIRFVPPESSEVVGVPRFAHDMDPSENGSKINAHQQETDWSAAFGFNSAKETSKGAMEAEDGPFLDEDEDLGFDPFCESQRGLEDLLRGESTGQDVHDPFFGYGRSTSEFFPTASGDSLRSKPLNHSSHLPSSQPHLPFPSQNKPHLYQHQQQQHPPLKSQTSLLDGLIQQHHESLEDLLPKSLDLSKKSSSAHPPGFFSSQQTSSRFFGPNGSMTSTSSSANHAAVGNHDAHHKNDQTESFLRSLMFDGRSSSSSSSAAPAVGESGRNPLEALQSLRTTPPTGIPPPPPGMGLPHQQQQYQQQQQHLQQKQMPNLPYAANASQRLPPGFSNDNLTRQNSNPNAIDDFLGRSGWSKMQQPNRSQIPNPLDNPSAAQLQHHQQQQQLQQQPQNYSKMMGLMNLGKAGKLDDFDHISSPFPMSNASAAAASASSGMDPMSRVGPPYGPSNQQPAVTSSSTSVKDWQEGFRALLPNVNISFSQNANLTGGAGSSGSTGFSSNLPPWDDPAIVTAANTSKHFNNNNNSPLRNNQDLRGNQEEQPHWMKSLQQLTEMTESAPTKQAQGSSPSAFLPTLAGINQSSLLGGPYGTHSVQQQQLQQSQPQHQQLMQGTMMGNRNQSDRLFQMGGDWGSSYSGGFSGPSLTSAPPGFRLPNATSSQPAPTGATN